MPQPHPLTGWERAFWASGLNHLHCVLGILRPAVTFSKHPIQLPSPLFPTKKAPLSAGEDSRQASAGRMEKKQDHRNPDDSLQRKISWIGPVDAYGEPTHQEFHTWTPSSPCLVDGARCVEQWQTSTHPLPTLIHPLTRSADPSVPVTNLLPDLSDALLWCHRQVHLTPDAQTW